jgi:hypothetical protein
METVRVVEALRRHCHSKGRCALSFPPKVSWPRIRQVGLGLGQERFRLRQALDSNAESTRLTTESGFIHLPVILVPT